MLFFLLSYPILGAGIKYIDDAFDEKKFNKNVALIIAPLLGILWAYTMLIDKFSATILLAIICGVLFKGKIDNLAHFAGLSSIMAIVVLTGIEIMIIPLIFLGTFAILDEVGNDVIDYNKKYLKKRKTINRLLIYFFDQRWLLKIAILGLVFLGMMPLYFFIAILLFDGAYLIMRYYSKTRMTKITLLAKTKKAKA